MTKFDVVIVGAGAAGLFCAGVAGQRGLKVLIVDHAPKLAEKIRISGGGRCNFTNREVTPANFLSENPHFCRSALAGYTPQAFIALVDQHGIAWHEKHKGQLFCDHRSDDIIQMLIKECEIGGVTRWQPCAVSAIRKSSEGFEIDTDRGMVHSPQLVMATGGLAIPKIGATDFGYRVAKQFDHTVVATRPALVPLTFDAEAWKPWAQLAGIALEVAIQTETAYRTAGGKRKGPMAAQFTEDLLFTHRGLSGPAVLQISSHWQAGRPIQINLTPQLDLAQQLMAAKLGSKKQLSTTWSQALGASIPARLADTWLQQAKLALPHLRPESAVAELKDKDLEALGHSANAWQLIPSGTEGYAKAEVTAGGVDTRELSSQSMESLKVAGLYFIGEVVDVTGWLGGYNFHWAWASAMACAQSLRQAEQPS
ncbi:MAG: NAD(P)/FAD-dependent oxidoreductase [Burkholderiales bacterium]|nr:NAD(P)/FAD-dependent oxidoreductase [Burkholderiales bacterium]MDE2431788.1 NAD(P)/FAD-dependent oxidoreductase [Burkholderiales bacterium]